MKKEEIEKREEEAMSLNEEQIAYQHREACVGITRRMTQAELESDCLALQESKRMMEEKIHRYFHGL